ncbi:N-acetyl-alpha-D-glucosaminyl L-malate synthase BshA [Candidatus Sumerlaeota bacterium]|nr:N-acetyl-alpha-D-glucosaminyl L-malate synthase BshA [Candidatus Sumerlaeota bacterium]
MHIAIVCYPTYGGSGVVATELGRQLAQRGHKVHFVSLSMPFRLQHRYHENIFFHEVDKTNYPLFGNESLYTLSLAAKLLELIERENLDIIHSHYAIPHAVSACLAKEMAHPRRIPTIVTLHGTDITLVGKEPAFKSVVRCGIERSDAVTAVSHWLQRETIREFEVKRPIQVIYNFFDFDTERYCKWGEGGCHRDHYAAPGEKIILHVSNFREVKRTPDVVRTFARIAKELPAKLLLVGDGPESGKTLALARELGVMDRVWYVGKQDVVEPFFCIADLFLFPSDHESFGLAALEALAFGTPVVASRSGALPEVITDGQDGFLADVGDCAQMGDLALKLLRDEALYQQMSDHARKTALERFAPKPIVDQYEQLYLRTIEAVHSPAAQKE